MNNPFSKCDEIEKMKLSNTYGEIKRLKQPNFDNFDRMVLLEFKKRMEQKIESDITMIDKYVIKQMLYDCELDIFKQLTTYQIEVK